MSDDTCNGWPNRETWAAALHIGNDEGLYFCSLEMARECADDEQPIGCLAERLRDMVAECAADSMVRREVGSMWRVDWHRIAKGMLDDV